MTTSVENRTGRNFESGFGTILEIDGSVSRANATTTRTRVSSLKDQKTTTMAMTGTAVLFARPCSSICGNVPPSLRNYGNHHGSRLGGPTLTPTTTTERRRLRSGEPTPL